MSHALFEVLSGGLAGSRVLDIVGPRLAAKDYAPTGPAKFMHKDLSFVLESAAAAGSAVPMATAGVELYAELKRQGLGDLDLAAVRQTISNLSDDATAAPPHEAANTTIEDQRTMSALFDLTGRVALVTGSSRGIGNALARALADAGATVVLNGINAERLKAADAAMAADFPPGRIHSCAFDVTRTPRPPAASAGSRRTWARWRSW